MDEVLDFFYHFFIKFLITFQMIFSFVIFFIRVSQHEKLTSRFLSNLRVTDAFINNEINLLVNHPEP